MARDVESLVLRMSADLNRFEKSMASMRATADRRLNEVEKRAIQSQKNLSRSMDRAGRDMVGSLKSSLGGMAPMLAGAFSTAAVLRYADSYTALQNRLKAAGLEGSRLKQVEDSLYESANRNGIAVEATAELYQRAAMARSNLGASEEQLLALVSGTSAALKLQGTSATEASGALLQLGQILGGEKVQAQEYNSLIDQLPVLLQAAADGSGRFGGEISTLTAQVKAGKVTTQEFFAALLNGLGDVETRAASATPTVGAAFQTLNNEIGRFVGQTDQGLSATQRMAQGIVALAENLDTVVLVVGAVATLMGGRFVLSMTAGSGAMIAGTVNSIRYQTALAGLAARQAGVTTATVVSTGAMRAFGTAVAANPIGALIIATAALAAGVMYLNNKFSEGEVVNRQLQTQSNRTSEAFKAYEDAALKAATATGEAKVAADALVKAKQALYIIEVQQAQALAQTTAQMARQRAEMARLAAQEATSAGPKTEGEAIGQLAYAGGTANEAARAQAQAEQAARDARKAEQDLADLQEKIRNGFAVAAPQAPPAVAGNDRGTSGPSQEDLARQRQMLDLQGEIELLRAQGRDAEADAKQDTVDLLNLTKQYDEAGFANAKAKAETQVAALATARLAADAAEEAKRQAEGEARAVDLTRGFVLDMLGVQESLALTERDSLAVRREILAVRQEERRLALEAAAADTQATEAERNAARDALGQLPSLERGEVRELEGSSSGARDAQDIAAGLNFYEDAVARAADAYAEIDRLRQEDVISEQEAARAKSQIDIDLQEQRLAGTRSVLSALETLTSSSNKRLAAIGKSAAVVQATIDGYLAIQKAWSAFPYPFNLPGVAATTIAVGANVAAIAGMADGGMVTGPGGPRQDNQLRWLSSGEFVNTAASVKKNRPYLEAANNGADLSKMIPGLANGGMVDRVSAATAGVSARGGRASNIAMTVAVDLKGARGDREIEATITRAVDAGAEAAYHRAIKDAPGAVRKKERYRMGGSSR